MHEEGYAVDLGADGHPTFLRPDGTHIPVAPLSPAWTGPALAPTDAHLNTAGITIHPDTATPDWHGESLDLDWAILVLHPASADPRPRDVPAGIAPGKAWREGKPCSSYDMTETF